MVKKTLDRFFKKHVVNNKEVLKNGKIKYIIGKDGSCMWYLIVNKIGIVESWHYISNPKLCTEKIGYFEPW